MSYVVSALWPIVAAAWAWAAWQRGWVHPVLDAVVDRLMRAYRWADRRTGHGPQLLVYLGVGLVAASPTVRWLAVPGAATLAAAHGVSERRRKREMRRLEDAVASARHDAVVAAVRAEIHAVRADIARTAVLLDQRVASAVEDILDDPMT